MNLTVSHDGGFFSCCSLRLHYLIQFFNKYKQLPDIYDTTGFYTWYKKDTTDDITFKYFKHYDLINDNIRYIKEIDYNECYQYKNYKKLDYELLLPFINKYFTPTEEIEMIKSIMEKKYSLEYDNICVLFYRGNDKITEIKLPSFNEYIQYGKQLLKTNPNITFLIQSDETNFINAMKEEFTNHIIFNDEIRHIYKMNTTVDKVYKEQNNIYSLKYLAITLIMSKCKYIICNSGNCSIWTIFFRGNTDNIIQLSIVESL